MRQVLKIQFCHSMNLIAATCLRIAKDGSPRIFSPMELNGETVKNFFTKPNNCRCTRSSSFQSLTVYANPWQHGRLPVPEDQEYIEYIDYNENVLLSF